MTPEARINTALATFTAARRNLADAPNERTLRREVAR